MTPIPLQSQDLQPVEKEKMAPHPESETAPWALVADDQPDVLEALRLLLRQAGYRMEAVTSPAAVIDALSRRQFDLLLMDLNYARDTTSGREGLDLLSRVHSLDDTLPIVVMTGWASIEVAVEAMQHGGSDFVQKPWDNKRLLSVLRAQVEQGKARRSLLRLENERRSQRAREFEEARNIQECLLPREIPQMPGCEIAAAWCPALGVGGDYLDVLKVGESKLAICVADVIGKGIPAALLMSNLQAAVKAFATGNSTPRDLCERVNRVIHGNIGAGSGRFITFFYCLLDAESGKLIYTNAGHNAPIVVRSTGLNLRLSLGGAALGAFENWQYEQGEIQLLAGDRVFLFTDGVTESRNAAGEEFGEDRLIQLVEGMQSRKVSELPHTIIEAAAEFGAAGLQDDATIVVLAVD